MRAYFTMTLLAKDRPGIVDEVSGRLHQAGFNIEDSRMATLGAEFGLILYASGPEGALEGVLTSLRELEAEGHQLSFRQTVGPEVAPAGSARVPYTIKVYGMDHEGIVHAFSEEMARREINVESLETRSKAAPLSGATLISLKMTVSVPSRITPNELRTLVSRLGDCHGVDATLTPAERE